MKEVYPFHHTYLVYPVSLQPAPPLLAAMILTLPKLCLSEAATQVLNGLVNPLLHALPAWLWHSGHTPALPSVVFLRAFIPR